MSQWELLPSWPMGESLLHRTSTPELYYRTCSIVSPLVPLLTNSCRMPLPPPNTAPPPDYLENGRLYHGYHKGSYMYPCDEASLTLYIAMRHCSAIDFCLTFNGMRSKKWIAWISTTNSSKLHDATNYTKKTSSRPTMLRGYWMWAQGQEYGQLTWPSKLFSLHRASSFRMARFSFSFLNMEELC